MAVGDRRPDLTWSDANGWQQPMTTNHNALVERLVNIVRNNPKASTPALKVAFEKAVLAALSQSNKGE